MSTFRLLLAEIRYRKLNFAMSVLAVVVAAGLFVAGPVLVEGYQRQTQAQVAIWKDRVEESEQQVQAMRAGMLEEQKKTAAELAQMEKETRRLMRDMGFNLMVVHRDTNMSDFWASDFAANDMPQEYVDRLAKDRRLTLVTHLVATLQAKIDWEGRKTLLVGYLPETPQAHLADKSPMGYRVRPGTVFLGYELGRGKKVGETIKVLNRDFQVARLLPEQGSKEDITIAMHLSDAQALLGKPNRISQIMALGCRCEGEDLATIRQQLATVLPETQITESRSIAIARDEQRALVARNKQQILAGMEANLKQQEQILADRRQTLADLEASRESVLRIIETLAGVVTPVVVLASAVWVGLLALANVRQRQTEIGLLRALGKGSGMIASLFLGKAVLVGIVGAVAGVLVGTWIAQWLGTRALAEVASESFPLRGELLFWALLGAPLVSAVASYLPTLTALMEDPAVVLREP